MNDEDLFNKIGLIYIFIINFQEDPGFVIYSSFGDIEIRVYDFIDDPLSSDLPKIMGKIAENWEFVDVTVQSYYWGD